MTISPTLLGKSHNYLQGFTSAPNVGNQCVLIMSRTISKFFIFLLKLLVTTWITCWTEIWVEDYVILVWRFGNIFKPNCDLPLAKQFKMAIYATILTHVLALQWNIFLKFVIRIHVSQIKKERGFFYLSFAETKSGCASKNLLRNSMGCLCQGCDRFSLWTTLINIDFHEPW